MGDLGINVNFVFTTDLLYIHLDKANGKARQRLRDGEPLADLARSYGVSASTISRLRPR